MNNKVYALIIRIAAFFVNKKMWKNSIMLEKQNKYS